MRTSALLLLSLAFLSAGCAKIGEPQPPEIRIAQPAADLAARQVEDHIVLTFSKPGRNTNGTEIDEKSLKRVDLLRLSEDPLLNDAAPVSEKEFIERAVRIASTPVSEFPAHLKDHTFTFRDRSLTEESGMYSHPLRYAVILLNNRNRSGGLSNQARITPIPIPSSPVGLSAEGSEDSIRLRWIEPKENIDGSTPPTIAGYNIYRSEQPIGSPSPPLNPEPVKGLEFQDRNFRFDTVYYYAVTTVGGPSAESQLLWGRSVRFECKDVYPPAPPIEFGAIQEKDYVLLLWEPSPSADLEGYRIYRKEKGTSTNRLLEKDLIKSLSYRDRGTETGKEYEYEIRAVDTHGNEGAAARTEIESR